MTVIKQKHRNSTKTYAILAYYVRTVQKKKQCQGRTTLLSILATLCQVQGFMMTI